MSRMQLISDAEWRRRRRLKEEWHKEAVEEYLLALVARAEDAGETDIHLPKGNILLKDGTYLMVEEIKSFFEEKGYVPTAKIERERRTRIIHAQMMTEEELYAGDNYYGEG